MPYSATARRLLISCPSDIPSEDIDRVSAAIGRWNAIYGPTFSSVVVPIHWRSHSTARHGDRPQAALNAQLVDEADIVLALFWQRLGSPTGQAESGTVEEFERAHDSGAYVAVLRCERPLPPDVDTEELTRLRAFLESLRTRSLVLGYSNDADLAPHVDNILAAAVTQDATRAHAAVDHTTAGAEVWPRIESSEHVSTDTRGQVKTTRRWRLVLANAGSEAARDVKYRLEAERDDDILPRMLDRRNELEALAPDGEASYAISLHMGVAEQVRCVVTWQDSRGERENRATLRFF